LDDLTIGTNIQQTTKSINVFTLNTELSFYQTVLGFISMINTVTENTSGSNCGSNCGTHETDTMYGHIHAPSAIRAIATNNSSDSEYLC
jgi:hypothetical protein